MVTVVWVKVWYLYRLQCNIMVSWLLAVWWSVQCACVRFAVFVLCSWLGVKINYLLFYTLTACAFESIIIVTIACVCVCVCMCSWKHCTSLRIFMKGIVLVYLMFHEGTVWVLLCEFHQDIFTMVLYVCHERAAVVFSSSCNNNVGASAILLHNLWFGHNVINKMWVLVVFYMTFDLFIVSTACDLSILSTTSGLFNL